MNMRNSIFLGLLSAGLLLVTPLNLLAAEQEAKITPPDGSNEPHFGGVVALSGDTAMVAWNHLGTNGWDPGRACIYVRSGPNWSLQAILTPEWLGDMRLCGDTAIIYSLSEVNVFARSGTNWSQQAKLYYPSSAGWDSARAVAL